MELIQKYVESRLSGISHVTSLDDSHDVFEELRGMLRDHDHGTITTSLMNHAVVSNNPRWVRIIIQVQEEGQIEYGIRLYNSVEDINTIQVVINGLIMIPDLDYHYDGHQEMVYFNEPLSPGTSGMITFLGR